MTSRIKSLTVLICLCLCGLGSPARSQPIDYEIYHNDPKGDLDGQNAWPADVVLEQQLENRLVRLLDGATQNIDCALYDFDRASISDALKRAVARRGVRVRVTVDGDQVPLAFTDDLANAGITVARESSLGAQSHNKYIIVDRTHLWTGSTNITNSCFDDNANNAILIHSPLVAKRFTEDFEFLIAGLFHNNANRQDIGVSWYDLDTGMLVEQIRNGSNDLTLQGAVPENLFPAQRNNNLEGLLGVVTSPKNNHADDLYVREIDRADKSILFCIYTFSHDPIRDAILRAAANRGVQVYGVFDAQNRNVAGGEYASLQNVASVNVKIDKYDGYLHDKFMVIDAGTGSDPTVLTGSYNWTALATTTNDENVVSVHDRAAADDYYRIFSRIYNDRALAELGVNAAALPARYAITGRVMDENGVAMAGIEVQLGGAESWSTFTDAQGDYAFETLLGNPYTVTVPDQGNNTFTTTLGGPQGANSRAYNPLAANKAGQDFYRFSGQVVTRTPTRTPTVTSTPTVTRTPTPSPTPTCAILDEDFEGAWPPAGWSAVGAVQSQVHPRSGASSAVFSANANTLTTPRLSDPGMLRYWMYATAGVSSFFVQYGFTPQGPWINLNGSPTVTDYAGIYKQETFDLSALRDIYIRFSRNSAKTYYLDDVSVSCNPITRTPTPTVTITPTPTRTPTPLPSYARLPYSTGFEAGGFDGYWRAVSVLGASAGVLRSQLVAHAGECCLALQRTKSITTPMVPPASEAWLRVNLAGKTNVSLGFYYRGTGGSNEIWLSNNGGATFKQVAFLPASSSWKWVSLKLDFTFGGTGTLLGNNGVIKFRHVTTSGLLMDNLFIDDLLAA